MKLRFNPFLLALLATPFVFTACSDDDDPGATTGTVRFDLRHGYNDQCMCTDDTLQLADGSYAQLSRVAYIVSDVRLVDASGTETMVNDYGFVVDATGALGFTSTPIVGEVLPGTYTELRFRVGLDDATNGQDPTALADDDPLNTPNMHWGWNPAAGYKFLVVEGAWGQSRTALDSALIYHHATNTNDVEVAVTGLNYTVQAGQVNDLSFRANYANLFTNLNVATQGTKSHTTIPAIHTQLNTNIPTVFSAQ